MEGPSYDFDRSWAERIMRIVRKSESDSASLPSPSTLSGFGEPIPTQFRNDSTETAPAYAVMAITGCTVVGGIPYVTINKPSTTFVRGHLVNANADIASSGFGFAYGPIVGPPVTVLYTTPPSAGDGYGPRAGSWKMEKNYPCTSEALGIVSSSNVAGSSDNPTMLATLHPINSIVGILKTTLAPRGTADVTIYANSTETSLSMTLSGVRDFLLASTDTSTSGPSTGSGCFVSWRNGQPYFDNISCTTH